VGTPARVEEMENVAKGLRKASGSYKYKLINLYKNCRCGPWMTYVLSFIGFNDEYLEVEPHSVGFIVANFSLQSSVFSKGTQHEQQWLSVSTFRDLGKSALECKALMKCQMSVFPFIR